MTTSKTVQDFFSSKLPETWFSELGIETDDDEILVVGTLPEGNSVEDFRESTRDQRIAIAIEAESNFRRKVSWGVIKDGTTTLFTTLGAPITTRLRLAERAVLDTLVEAGVARSRSDALSWCVKLVGRHQAEWLADLRGALIDVERVRADGPTLL